MTNELGQEIGGGASGRERERILGSNQGLGDSPGKEEVRSMGAKPR